MVQSPCEIWTRQISLESYLPGADEPALCAIRRKRMRRTAKNRDSDLGCLLQSAIIAVVLIALTAYSLDQLDSLIRTEGTPPVVRTDEEHADEETVADEHADEESPTTDQQTTVDDQTDQEASGDEQPAVDGQTGQAPATAQPTVPSEEQTTVDDQTDQEASGDEQPTVDSQTDQAAVTAQPTVPSEEQVDEESPTTDQQTTVDGQTDQATTTDEQAVAGDQESSADEQTVPEDQITRGVGSIETADSVVDTTDEEAKEPEDGVVSTDTTGAVPDASNMDYDPAVVAEGESLFVLCAACHGPDARGLPGLGLDLLDSEFVDSRTDEELRDFVLIGRPVWDPANTTGVDMPPKGGNPALTEEDILRIIAYIRTLQARSASGEEATSETPTPEMTEMDIVALGYDPAVMSEGESLFVLCAACHGPDARGLPGLGLDLLASEFVDSHTDQELRDFVLAGRPVWDPTNTTGVDMPPEGGNSALTDEDILKIIAYIRVLDVQGADNGPPTAPNTETDTDPAPASGTESEVDLAAAGYDPDIVSQGESLFVLCAACHGPDAQGLPGLGLDLITSQFVGENDDEALLEFVLAGRPVWDPANTTGVDMPPKGGNPALMEEDILMIIAYLRTLRANSTS
jgi:mono/diheme cytochrome c family protein